jgi:hypothetical protein
VQVPAGDGSANALADFLVAKDASTGTFVIEDDHNAFRGLVAVDTAVDAAVLLQHFDLTAYDGLLPPDDFTALASEAAAALLAENQAAATAKHAQLLVRCQVLPRKSICMPTSPPAPCIDATPASNAWLLVGITGHARAEHFNA